MKLRVRFAKRGRLRFTSHRDFQRSLERAVRRAGLPIAFSQGFSPHPKISYIGAAPTGTASEAEYLEITLTEDHDPAEVLRRLDAALPTGLDIVEVVAAGPGSLADRIMASEWEIRLPGVAADEATAALAAFLVAQEVTVERIMKDGRRQLDARGPVVRAEAGGTGDCAILQVVVRHVIPAVRPDDVLAGLRSVAGLALPVPPSVTRLAQGSLDEQDPASGRLSDPLAPDRSAAADPGPGVVGSPPA